jgi:spermidine synthase
MRRFAVLLGATAPATAAALAAFFVGFGLGSYLLGRLASRLVRPLRAFAILEIMTGASALAVDPLLRATHPVLASLYDTPGDTGATELAIKIAIAIISVLVPATAIGGTLPVLAQFVTARAESLGIRVGGLYAVNTFGACAGALAVPAILLPALGATGAVGAAIAINVCVAAGALLLDRAADPIGAGAASVRSARGAQKHRRPVERWRLPLLRAQSHWRSRHSRRAHLRWCMRILCIRSPRSWPFFSPGWRPVPRLRGRRFSARSRRARSPQRDGRVPASGWCCSRRSSCELRGSAT